MHRGEKRYQSLQMKNMNGMKNGWRKECEEWKGGWNLHGRNVLVSWSFCEGEGRKLHYK